MTAAALRLSMGSVRTAKMLVPLSCEAVCFSASAGANTSTTMCEAWELIVSTAARRLSTSRASIARSCVVRRLLPICSSAVSTESTGRTDVVTAQRFADLQEEIVTSRNSNDFGCRAR